MTRTDLQQMYSSKRSQLLEKSLIVLERELKWREENERLQFYAPNRPIDKLINLVGDIPNLVYILSAANGIGKTTALVNIAGNLFFGPQNSYFKTRIFKDWPYPKRIRFVSEVSQIEEGKPLPTEISKWWPKGRYQTFKDSKHYVSRYESGDWVMEVMTYDQTPKQHEGQNLGMVLFNEPPPESLWTPNISRLRAGGMAIVGMTPLTEAGWFFDKIVPRHEAFTVYGDVEEACKVHGKNGHLEHENIERMIQEYDPEEREARIQGKAMYLKGIIFSSFDPTVHVLKEELKASATASMYQIVDPHDDKPFACLWGFPDAIGDVYIVDEWPNEDFYKMHNCQLNVQDYAKIFKDKEQRWNVSKRIMDRRYGEVSRTTNRKTLREEFAEKTGLRYEQSYSAQEEIETGILKIRSYLGYNPEKEISPLNKPKLYINPSCKNTIKSLSRWARDPKTGKVQESYKDFIDLLRYFLMSDLRLNEEIPRNQPNRYG